MRTLYLPITSQPRELDSRILLALVAAERGIPSVVGYKSSFEGRLQSLSAGIFLAHNARQKSGNFRPFVTFGHGVVVLDEEALVRQSDEIFLKKHGRDDFDDVAHVLCWGQDDFELWRGADVPIPCDISIVGNPRFDLMREELRPYHGPRVAALREECGDYVLLNTNFPTVNNLTPQGGGLRLANWARDERGTQLESGFLANKRRMFEATLAVVRPLAAAIAPTTLVIRPHPNEDHTPWFAAAQGLRNVRIMFEGGVVPWLIGARALVHNSCTTAVEAAAAGTPVLNFRPWRSEFDNDLSHAFGIDCSDATELAAALGSLTRNGGASHAHGDRLRRHVDALSGPLACDRIIDVVEKTMRSRAAPTRAGLFERVALTMSLRREFMQRAWRLYCRRGGRRRLAALRRHFPRLNPLKMDANFLSYSEQQFALFARQSPPLSPADLDDRIRRFSEATGRFGGIRAKVIDETLFSVSPRLATRACAA